MRNFKTFQVLPNIPQKLQFLEVLSRNMWWCWDKDAIDLFRRIDPGLWTESGRNPIAFLTKIDQSRFEKLAKDKGYLAHLKEVREQFQIRVLDSADQSESVFGPGDSIAYFSMEFGIHESLPLFAGGLGILAGDHLKAASNIGLPLTGMGLMYHHGYFRQYLNPDGWQQEAYPETDLYELPAERVLDEVMNCGFRLPGRKAPFMPSSGKSWSAAFHCICWIPIFLRTSRFAVRSRQGSMPPIKKFAWPRRCCWESAGCERWRP